MPTRQICLLCHSEIPHPGAECPRCKHQERMGAGVTAQLLALIFGVMFVCFVITGFLTRSFRQERRDRGQQHDQLAQTLSDYGYYADAIREYSDALTYLPDSLESRLGLAQSLYAVGRYNEAENHLLDLRRSDPTWALVNRSLARIVARRGDIPAAVNYYQTAIYGRWRRHPAENRLRVRLELVELLKQHGENRQLVGQLLELLDEAPGNLELRKQIGFMLIEAQSPGNAREVFEEVVRQRRTDGEAYAGQGQAEFALGNYDSAYQALLTAGKLKYESEEVSRLVGLTRAILSLDPTARGLAQQTRLRRSQQLLERTLAAVEHCVNPQGPDFAGPPAPPPDGLRPWLEEVRGRMAQQSRQRADQETIEANVALAKELWNRGQAVCAGREPAEPALAHVLSAPSR
jgi:tetratricopeptide (TPR) repeat protein